MATHAIGITNIQDIDARSRDTEGHGLKGRSSSPFRTTALDLHIHVTSTVSDAHTLLRREHATAYVIEFALRTAAL